MNSFLKVSIIVPIYMTPEKLLRKCIESATSQTIKEIEILLIDDSPNETGGICDEYAQKDSRIRVFHQCKGGLSAGRNKGFSEAKGEWITFLDSDDWIESNTCAKTVEIGETNSCDVVLFGTRQEFKNRAPVFKYNIKDNTIFTGDRCKEIQKEILNNYGNIATAWAKLFNRKFLLSNELYHDANLSQGSEGVEFNIRVFDKVRKAVFISDPLYHYVFYNNSLSASYNEKNYYLTLECLKKIREEINDSNIFGELYSFWCKRVQGVVISTAVGGYFSPKTNIGYKERVKKFEAFMNTPIVLEAMQCKDTKEMGIIRRVVLFLIRKKLYSFIIPIGAVRYHEKNS